MKQYNFNLPKDIKPEAFTSVMITLFEILNPVFKFSDENFNKFTDEEKKCFTEVIEKTTYVKKYDGKKDGEIKSETHKQT